MTRKGWVCEPALLPEQVNNEVLLWTKVAGNFILFLLHTMCNVQGPEEGPVHYVEGDLQLPAAPLNIYA